MTNQEYEQRNTQSTVYEVSPITGRAYRLKVRSPKKAFEANWKRVQKEEAGIGLIGNGNDLRARLTTPNGKSLGKIFAERKK